MEKRIDERNVQNGWSVEMVEKFNEKANTLAREYWRLKKLTTNKAGGNRLKEIEKLLEKGIGGKLREQLDAEAKQLRKEKDDRSSAFEKLDGVERQILELTADLAPNLDLFDNGFFPYDSEFEPIAEEYFSVLTNIFFGTPQPSIQFKVATLSKDGIKLNLTEGQSSLEVLGYVLMIIQETAKKLLGVENLIDKSSALLKQNEYAFIVLGILLKEGRSMGIKELKEIAHRDDKEYKELMSDVYYDKELVNSIAYLVSDEWEYGLLKEHDGKYEATDFGERVWQICNAEASEGKWKMKRASSPNSSLNIQKILKFFKK